MPTTDDGLQWVRDQLTQLQSQPAPTMATASPNDGTRPGWTGLLGEVLGGGQTPGYQLRGREADTSGNRALLNFGIQTLLASGPAPVRPDVFSAVASGLQGAQQSMDLDQRRAMALAQQDYTNRSEAWKQKLEGIKAAIPLLTLQQQMAQASAARQLAGVGTPSSGAAGGDLTGDKAHDLPLIAQRESGGDPTALNFVAKADPTAYARGATASGKYQIVNSTWAEGMRLAGLDPSQYATARDAPEAVQDKVASALFDKHGNTPWQKGAQDWVKGADGRYTLQAVAKPAGAPSAPGAPTTATAATTPPAGPPGVLQGSPGDRTPPPPPGAPAGPYAGGGVGAVLGGAPPPPAPSDRVANARATGAALLAAKQTGKAVPIAGGNGLVANPDGTVGPPGGGFKAPPSVPPKVGDKVAEDVGIMQGGMQLAQAQRGQDGSVLAAGPAAGGAPATAAPSAPRPDPGWGTAVGTYGGGGPAAIPPPAPATVPQPATPAVPPKQFPDVTSGDVVIRHPGSSADFQAREMPPPPQTEDFNPHLTAAQEAAFNLRRQQIATLPFTDQPKAAADLTAEIAKTTQDKAQAAAAALTKFNEAQRAAVQTRYEAAVSAYNEAAKSKFTFNQDIVKSQSEKQDAANQKILEPYHTGATQAQQILPHIDLAQQVLPGLPENAAPWLAKEENRQKLAPFERYMPANWREAVQSADTFQQVMGGMVSQMGANVVSGQPGGRESAYEQFKSALPILSQSAEGRERALLFMGELAHRRIAEDEFMSNYAMDPKNRDPELKVANMSGARTAMNTALGPMVRLPPVRYDPNAPGNTPAGQANAKAYADYFTRLPDNARYVTYSQGPDGKYHPVVRVKAPGQTRPEAVQE